MKLTTVQRILEICTKSILSRQATDMRKMPQKLPTCHLINVKCTNVQHYTLSISIFVRASRHFKVTNTVRISISWIVMGYGSNFVNSQLIFQYSFTTRKKTKFPIKSMYYFQLRLNYVIC